MMIYMDLIARSKSLIFKSADCLKRFLTEKFNVAVVNYDVNTYSKTSKKENLSVAQRMAQLHLSIPIYTFLFVFFNQVILQHARLEYFKLTKSVSKSLYKSWK